MPAPSKAAPTAIVYCRTSTAGQAEGETIAAQIERCRRLVERHGVRLIKYGNGWTPQGGKRPVIPANAGWIVDDGISGSLLDGRAFGGFLDALQAKRVKVDHVIVFSLSRLSRLDKTSGDMTKLVRSHEHNARIKGVLIGRGVTVLDEEGVNDPATTIYDLKTAISVGQYNEIKKSTTAGKQRLCAAGAWPKGGNPPYGYRRVFVNGVDRKASFRLEPDPDAACNLRALFGWYVEGGVTFAATKATEARFPPPKASATRKAKDEWWPSSVVALVRVARMYALGEQTLAFGGEPHTVKFKPIIDGKMYEAVSRRAKQRTLKHRATFLSTGFVDCACGAHVHARSCYAGRRHYIRCANACGTGGVHEDRFSVILWGTVIGRLLQIRQHEGANGHDADNGDAALKDARAKVEAVTADIARLVDVYLTAGLDKAIFKQKNDELNDRKATAQAEVDGHLREREARAAKKATVESVEARVAALLEELFAKQPTLDRKREVLAEVLAGGRVIVTWPKEKSPKRGHVPMPTITLPPFGSHPALSVNAENIVEVVDQVVAEDLSFRERYEHMIVGPLGKSITDDLRHGMMRAALHTANLVGDPDALDILESLSANRPKRGWTDDDVRNVCEIADHVMPPSKVMAKYLREIIDQGEHEDIAKCRELLAYFEGGPEPTPPLTPGESSRIVAAVRVLANRELGVPKGRDVPLSPALAAILARTLTPEAARRRKQKSARG